jgi:predicted lipid-binding transport protein (Tim44 family)
MLFGNRGYTAPSGETGAGGGAAPGGGGIGLFDILILAGIGYLLYKFFWKRRRMQASDSEYHQFGGFGQTSLDSSRELPQLQPMATDTQQGLEQIRQFDSTFNEADFKEKAQDIFFRVQAAWMNRNLDGSQNLLTDEMIKYMNDQFAAMLRDGKINRLENIAVRSVEITEAWQETGRDYITVLFTANLLDYTVDDKTNQVIQGDRLNPVKFQEFWTFCRDIGSSQWKLSAINQVGQ